MVFPAVMYGYESWTIKKPEHQRIDVFELWCWRRLLRVPWTTRILNQSILKEISPKYSLEGLMLRGSNTLATWCKELTYWKRPWCWERLKTGGEGNDRGWDGWMASLTWWTRVWVSSGSWWWTGKPEVMQSMGCKESDKTEWLNWTDPSHQEAYRSLLGSSTRGQTEKARRTTIPQQLKQKPHYRKLIKMKKQRVMSQMKG